MAGNINARPIAQCNATGTLIKIFPSQNAAAKELRINSGLISMHLAKGKPKLVGGWIFRMATVQDGVVENKLEIPPTASLPKYNNVITQPQHSFSHSIIASVTPEPMTGITIGETAPVDLDEALLTPIQRRIKRINSASDR